MDSGFEQSRASTPKKKARRLTCTDGFNNLFVELRGTFEKLNELWDQVEMDDEKRCQRIETAFKVTKDLLAEMIEGETKMVESVEENIKIGIDTIEKRREQLELEMWTRPKHSLSSLVMLKLVKSEIAALEEEFAIRNHDQRVVIEKFNNLCVRVADQSESLSLDEESLLSMDEFATLTAKCEEMESQVRERMETLRDAQQATQRALKILDKKECEIDKALSQLLDLEIDDEHLVLSDELIHSYKEANAALQLEVNDFITTLEFEYTEKWIALKDLWVKCGISSGEARFQEEFSADLHDRRTLKRMEEEIARLLSDYERRKEVLGKLEEWRALWEEKLAHEDFERAPDRFTNRGGELEKRLNRDRLVNRKLLPQMEHDVATAYESYKLKYPEGFFIDGVQPVEWIRWKKTTHDENKDFEARHVKMMKAQTPGNLKRIPMAVSPAIPDLSVIGPCQAVTPGPKTSSPKTSKRPPPMCSSPCPSPAKRTKAPFGKKNWMP
ncbi:unnamed protein product, partial [Mesorhabditis belari]|uniref:Protein regulator of cytokinesis 1 n=1 Tax=Mesorhabditis belari TaxID=2138241 RepID=A0AAF3FED1_9BILA